MVRYLQDPRHDGAGRSLQLHIFRAFAICEHYEDERGTVCKNSGVLGRKQSVNTWLSEDEVTSRSSEEDMGIQEGVMVHFINQILGRSTPIHLLKHLLQ